MTERLISKEQWDQMRKHYLSMLLRTSSNPIPQQPVQPVTGPQQNMQGRYQKINESKFQQKRWELNNNGGV